MIPTAVCCVALACVPSPDGEELFSDLSFGAALERAGASDRVVLVDFFTTWCAPCKQLDETTWKDPDVIAWLSERAVCLKLDAEVETELAARYRVGVYPTLLFLAPDGTERGRIVGYRDAAGFLREAPARLAGRTELEEIEELLAVADGDPSLRMRHGDALAQAGRFEEALAEYLWCFDEGLEADPSFVGVRLSFLLSRIAGLGGEHPPALEALRQRAAVVRARLLLGEGDSADVQDLCALYEELGATVELLAIYDVLVEQGGTPAETLSAMFDGVLDLLIAAERFEDVLRGAGDVHARFEQAVDGYERVRAFFEGQELPEGVDGPADYMRRHTVELGGKLYAALLGTGDAEGAARMAASVLELDASAATWRLLVETAAEREAWPAARDLLERGLAAVPEDEQGPLRRAGRSLPPGERPGGG